MMNSFRKLVGSVSAWLKLSTAAAKSRQSCPTLCDPTGGSPPGSRPWDPPSKNIRALQLRFSLLYHGRTTKLLKLINKNKFKIEYICFFKCTWNICQIEYILNHKS